MHKSLEKHNYLTVNGYTINPIKDSSMLRDIVLGLVGYKEFHKCDYGINDIVHKNYLGKIVGPPNIQYIDYDGYRGLTALVFLTNGYFSLKILDSIYPAEIQFDLYIRGELNDPDLIIDHLAAPGVAHDGMGMFDYTYDLKSTKIPQHKLSRPDANFVVNNLNKNTLDSLNYLESTHCYFCNNRPEYWIFLGPNENETTKSALVCKDHKSLGRSGELIDPFLVGKPSNAIINLFDRQNVYDDDGNFLYTINKRIED